MKPSMKLVTMDILTEEETPYGHIPLEWAVVFNHFECCKILLEHGAVIDDGDSPSLIVVARNHGYDEILALLETYDSPPVKEPDINSK